VWEWQAWPCHGINGLPGGEANETVAEVAADLAHFGFECIAFAHDSGEFLIGQVAEQALSFRRESGVDIELGSVGRLFVRGLSLDRVLSLRGAMKFFKEVGGIGFSCRARRCFKSAVQRRADCFAESQAQPFYLIAKIVRLRHRFIPVLSLGFILEPFILAFSAHMV
jgi:hypothetical protein